MESDDDGELKFLPVVSQRARAKLNQMAARKTRPRQQTARPLAQLRAWWKASAILTSGVAVDVIDSLLEYARAAAAAIRARVAAVVDVALAAVDVAATVFVMNEGGRFHRRHLLAEARRHLALVLAAAAATRAWTTESWPPPSPPTAWTSASRRPCAAWRPTTASTPPGGTLSDLPARRHPHTPAPGPDRQPPADPGEPAYPGPPDQKAGEWYGTGSGTAWRSPQLSVAAGITTTPSRFGRSACGQRPEISPCSSGWGEPDCKGQTRPPCPPWSARPRVRP